MPEARNSAANSSASRCRTVAFPGRADATRTSETFVVEPEAPDRRSRSGVRRAMPVRSGRDRSHGRRSVGARVAVNSVRSACRGNPPPIGNGVGRASRSNTRIASSSREPFLRQRAWAWSAVAEGRYRSTPLQCPRTPVRRKRTAPASRVALPRPTHPSTCPACSGSFP